MSQQTDPVSMAVGLPSGAMRWPHLQRLAQRWLRRWGYALSGLALGLWGGWLSQTEVSEDHAKAVQVVAGLQLQVAVLPAVLSAKPETPMSLGDQNMLASLPTAFRQENIWGDVQQLLRQHGLRLLSLRPMPPTAADSRQGGLSSLAMTVQLQGRFEDWSRLWVTCALTGPLCAIERISVLAMAPSGQVQIDAVLRVWIRPGEVGVPGGPAQTAFFVPAPLKQTSLAHERAALFAPALAVASPMTPDAARVMGSTDPKPDAASGPAGNAAWEALSDDPQHWPLDRVRLVGLWRQGGERQAIVSAGPHWARVAQGQRITLEGHRVESITDEGVSLRLAQQPLVELHWKAKTGDHKTGDGKKR